MKTHVSCSRCAGKGIVKAYGGWCAVCPVCGGSGYVEVTQEEEGVE